MECRICFDNTDEELIKPCNCSGSMEWVHVSCLQKWIYHKKDNICPVCKTEFNIENKSNTKSIIAFLLKSELFTTILTVFICILLLHFSMYFEIKSNTIALCFFSLIFGMHYIQILFKHEEISFDFLFNTLYMYSSHDLPLSYNCFNLICVCIWMIIDRIKYKLLSPYL